MASSKELTLYHCSKCEMHFTGGAEMMNVRNITGKPPESMVEGVDFGAGVCPNCGSSGKDVGVHAAASAAKEVSDNG